MSDLVQKNEHGVLIRVRDEGITVSGNELLNLVKSLLNELKPEQRRDVISDYCHSCGDKAPCHCDWND